MEIDDTERDEYVYLARNAQKAERYSEMFEAMRCLSTLGVDLTVDERNLLSVAFEQVTEPRRTSWRTLSYIKQQEVLKRNNQTVRKIEESMKDVAEELAITCNCMILMIDELLPSSKSEELSIFYHKMKGDCFRYLAECKQGADRQRDASKSYLAYEAATAKAKSELSSSHPLRLRLALNFAFFYDEIKDSPESAYSMAKLALDDAITELDKPDAESYSDSFMVMQLIRDNLTLWSPDIVDEEGFAGTTLKQREFHLNLAQIEFQANRYDDMVEKMICVAKLNVELSVTERKWLSAGYKNVIDPKRASWNILSNIEQKEVVAGHQQNARNIKDLMKKVEDEISSFCSGILSIIDQHLLPSSKTVESVIFLHKIKGDFLRYLAEFKEGDDRCEDALQSLENYETATIIAMLALLSTDPIRLDLALCFAIFQYEIMNSPERACDMANLAFNEAASELDMEELCEDSSLIMQLLRDNLTHWTSDITDEEEEDQKVNTFKAEDFEGK